MKKEYFIFIIAGLVVFEYVLDTISGPVNFVLKNPFMFLAPDIISTYPLTAVSIGSKTLALVISVPLALSLINKKYILKGIIVFVLAAILELYAIQQLATGMMITPIQWTLSFAFTGVALLILSVFYPMVGILKKTFSFLAGVENSEEFHF